MGGITPVRECVLKYSYPLKIILFLNHSRKGVCIEIKTGKFSYDELQESLP